MIYRESVPSPALRPYVRCYWRLVSEDGDPMPEADRVLPDGRPEIVLHRAEPFRRVEHGIERVQEPALLVGQISRALVLRPGAVVDVMGIRLEPGGMRALLGVPMRALTDGEARVEDADRVLGRQLREARDLADESARIVAVERALGERLRAAPPRERTLAAFVAEAVLRLERGASVLAVAAALRTSRRSLERRFEDAVGLSPKHYQRVRRLQRAVARMERLPDVAGDWASLAAASGFADQSHLIREFRLLAGTTPERYRRDGGGLGELFCDAAPPSHSSNR